MSIIASASVPESSRLTGADTVDLAAIRRDVGRRSWELLQRDGQAASFERVADQLGIDRQTAVTAAAEHIRERTATGCPPWCSKDHRGHITECEGFSIGLVHERIVTELTAIDPTTTTDPATATVYVESTTEVGESDGPEVITAPRVVLTVAEGPSGDYAGGEGVQGWTGTPAEARALAAALLAGAELVDPA